MADGKTHEVYQKRGWILIVPLGIFLFVVTSDILYTLFLYFNYSLTDFIDCDTDHPMMTKGEYDALRKFKNMSLGAFVPGGRRFSKLNRILSRFNLGLVGALLVAWMQIYHYISAIFGGHRSWFSHGHIIGTIGRMAWFNTPISYFLWNMVSYAIVVWEHPPWSEIGWNYFWMLYWIPPYLITQFLAWVIADEIHLLLDSNWSKGRLYGFFEFEDGRSKTLKVWMRRFKINDEEIDPKKPKRKRR